MQILAFEEHGAPAASSSPSPRPAALTCLRRSRALTSPAQRSAGLMSVPTGGGASQLVGGGFESFRPLSVQAGSARRLPRRAGLFSTSARAPGVRAGDPGAVQLMAMTAGARSRGTEYLSVRRCLRPRPFELAPVHEGGTSRLARRVLGGAGARAGDPGAWGEADRAVAPQA